MNRDDATGLDEAGGDGFVIDLFANDGAQQASPDESALAVPRAQCSVGDAASASAASAASTASAQLMVVDPGQQPRPSAYDALQHYPTPRALALKFWGSFSLSDLSGAKILDAFAGRGDLSRVLPDHIEIEYAKPGSALDLDVRPYLYSEAKECAGKIDAVEIDAAHHGALRDLGYTVVGLDFEDHTSLAQYSLVCMNPPFARGAHYALLAWDRMLSGSIGVILNAETIRNPCTHERRRLLELIAEHGRIEFVEDAFSGPGVQRTARVDVALVRLDKPKDNASAWVERALDGLAASSPVDAGGLIPPNEVALPRDFIQSQFDAYARALAAGRESIRLRTLAERLELRLGQTMEATTGLTGVDRFNPAHEAQMVVKELTKLEKRLRNRAWTSVLDSSKVEGKLSSHSMTQIRAKFEEIQELAFTPSNIYGFLCGLSQSIDEIQEAMILEVFDELTRYFWDNTVHYRGWWSNNVHAKAGRRLRTRRLVLPKHEAIGKARAFYTHTLGDLGNIDKVFAILDGSGSTEGGIVDAFRHNYERLMRRERVEAKYFGLRYYAGIGTVHLYPSDQALLDRFNRYVGQRRRWLPPEHATGHEGFWRAHAQAERSASRLQEILARRHGSGIDLQAIANGAKQSHRMSKEQALQEMGDALDELVAEQGLLEVIEHERQAYLAAEGQGGAQDTARTRPQALLAGSGAKPAQAA